MSILKKIFIPLCFTIVLVSCQEKPRTTKASKTTQKEQSVSIPMHGTKAKTQSFSAQQQKVNTQRQSDSLSKKE